MTLSILLASRLAKIRSLLILLVSALCLASPSSADTLLDAWRDKIAVARMLAENDAPQAYNRVQHLASTIPSAATAADRARALNLLSRVAIYLAHTDEAANHARSALEIAERHSDAVGQIEANLNMTLNAINQAKMDDLGVATRHGLIMLEGINRPDLVGEAMLRTSMMYRQRGQRTASVTLAMQAMDIAQRSNDPMALTFAYQGLAIAYDESSREKEAREYFQLMREQARTAQSKLLEADALIGLGGATTALGDSQAGEAQVREAIGIYVSTGAPFYVARALLKLAEILRQQHRFADALSPLDQATKIYEQHDHKIGQWRILNASSETRQMLGHLALAQTEAEQGHRLAKAIGLPLYLAESTKRLANLAAARGDHRTAYPLAIEAADIVDKAARVKAGEHMIALAERYQAESRQRQIDELTRNNEQQALQQRWLWTMLGCSVTVLAGAMYFLRRLRRSNRMLEALNKQVRRSEKKLQATLDAIPDLLFVLDLDGRYYECHSPRTDLLATTPETLLGKTVFDILSPEAANVCLSALREAHEKGTSIGKQFELTLLQGKFWFELSVARKTVAEGGSPRFIVLSRDITERKAHSLELQRWRDIFEHAEWGVVVGSVDGKLLELMNPAFARMHGYTVAELTGRPIAEVFAPEARAALPEQIRLAHQKGHHSFESLHLHKDGTIFPVFIDVTTVREASGQVVHRIVNVQDITERKKTETLLHEREQAIRAVVENSPDFIVRYDDQCRRTYVNPAMQALFGSPLEEILGKTPAELSPLPEAFTYTQMIRKVLESGQEMQVEYVFRNTQGEERSGHMRLMPEFCPKGSVISVLALGRDISALKEAEKRLAESYAQLRELTARREAEREEERRRIARELHDELGQLLTAIRMEISVLKLQYNSVDAQFQEKTQRIVALVDKTIRGVRDVVIMLRPAALERGIIAALEWLADEFRACTGIAVELQVRDKRIELDEERAVATFRIVQESLTNVARHSGAGKVTITLERKEDSYYLIVIDNGKGFDLATQKKNSLGLVGIRERVLSLGGELNVDSVPGRGTTLEVHLPLQGSE